MFYQFIRGNYNSDGSITLHVRDEKKKKDQLKILGFKPYFYVPSDAYIPDDRRILEVEDGYVGIDGRKLKKIVMSSPTDVKEFREKFDVHYEADIRFIRRFLIDTGIRSGIEIPEEKKLLHYTQLKPVDFNLIPVICFLDIEAYAKSRFPDAEHHEIVCATIWDTKFREYVTVLVQKGRTEKKVTERNTIYIVPNEATLLSLLKKYFSKLQPDVLSGWNIEWDVDYIQMRCKKYKLDLDLSGTCIFDLYKGYSKLYNKASNRLKDVVLNEGIADNVISDEYRWQWYENDPLKLAAYNCDDVKFCVLLDKKYSLIKFYWDLKNTAGLDDMMEVIYHGVLIDTLLLREYFGKYVLPSKPEKIEYTRGYSGGIVLKPPKGIFENVADFDASRYYPNIIIALNLTPEKSEETGIVPKLCLKLMDKRNEYEKQLNSLKIGTDEYESMLSKRNAVKYLLNAVYGYFGSPKSRLYLKNIAATITETGRKGLMFLKEKTEEIGYKVLYMDTDSIFIQVPFEKLDEVDTKLNEILEEFGKENGLKRALKLKCDKYFRRILFTGVKKRYAGLVVWEGRDVDYIYIRGFEYVKRDSSLMTKRIQREAFDYILREKAEGMKNYLKKTVEDMKKGKYSFREVAIQKTLNKQFQDYKNETDYLRGTKYANKYFGFNIKPGDQVKILYVKRVKGYPETDVICFLDEDALPDGIEVDWEKMTDKTIRCKVEDLLDIVGLSWERIMGTKSLMEVFG